MKTKIQYNGAEDRAAIIKNNKEKFLIEEQNILEGNFLIFSDILPLDHQLASLQDDNLMKFEVLATIYEELLMKG